MSKEKHNSINKVITSILIILCIYSAFSLFKIITQYYENNNSYKNIQNLVPSISESNNLSQDEFNSLKNLNKDFVFWITIPGTNINYPVVQTTDNEKYLNENFEGQNNKAGSIFVDCSSDIENGNNMVIHGHNMKDNSMFGSLKNLNDEDFLSENNKIYIYGLNGINERLEFEVFSVYIENASDYTYTSKFDNINDFDEYIDNSINKSFYNLIDNFGEFKEEVRNSKILTLSTCKNAVGNERLIVQAKLAN